MGTDNKFTLGVNASIDKDANILPEIKLKDIIDDNQDISIKISKDNVNVEYELRF